jgi:predicted Zn-dependent peptidase
MKELLNKEFIKELNTNLYSNVTEKFKTASLQVTYRMNANDVDIDAMNILTTLLADACKDYPSTPLLSSYLEDLYGCAILPKVAISGNSVTVSFMSSFISDVYSEQGLSNKVIELMSKIIYQPFFKNGKFEKEYFEFEKKKCVSRRQKALENKESTAALKFSAIIEKEYGTKALMTPHTKLEKVTLNRVMNMYNLLINSGFEILVIGDLDINAIKDSFINYFPASNPLIKLDIVVPFEKEIKSKVEKNDKFSQSYLIALYNIDTNIDSDEKEHFAALLYSFLLHDRYFDVVREKHGLCYAISNTYLNTNNAFRMTAGIDASKYRKTMSLVNKEINKVKQGKINNKVWNKTIELLTGLIANGKDDLASCLRDLENYATRSNYTSAERSIEIIKSLTKEDVIRIANKTRFLTSYLLKGTGTAGGEGNE